MIKGIYLSFDNILAHIFANESGMFVAFLIYLFFYPTILFQKIFHFVQYKFDRTHNITKYYVLRMFYQVSHFFLRDFTNRSFAPFRTILQHASHCEAQNSRTRVGVTKHFLMFVTESSSRLRHRLSTHSIFSFTFV